MTDITYLDPRRVTRVYADDNHPTHGQTASGYGAKIPTRYRLTLDDGRTRRVYTAIYGNIGSLYVVAGGTRQYLSTDVESMIEYERDNRINDDPRTFDASDAGCLIDSHYGWHAHGMLIDLAVSAGMPFYYGDRIAIESYRTSDNGNDDPAVLDHVLDTGRLLDRAEAWLNDHAAPAGHSFGWHDGEFYLTPDDEVWVN